MNHMGIVRDAIFSQDIFHVISRKMNPIGFCAVNPVIVVALFLLRPVQNHVSCGHDFFPAMEIEMSLSGGDIKQLVIETSPGPVGGKPGPGKQLIYAGASHKEGMLLILEIQVLIVPVGIVCIHGWLPPLPNCLTRKRDACLRPLFCPVNCS